MSQDLFVKDIEWLENNPNKIGDSVYLVRKHSNHILECKLTAISVGTIPTVEVEWLKSFRYQYRLNLKDNTVHAIDATIRHKDEMKAWYTVYEPHRKSLIKICEQTIVSEKKRKKIL